MSNATTLPECDETAGPNVRQQQDLPPTALEPLASSQDRLTALNHNSPLGDQQPSSNMVEISERASPNDIEANASRSKNPHGSNISATRNPAVHANSNSAVRSQSVAILWQRLLSCVGEAIRPFYVGLDSTARSSSELNSVLIWVAFISLIPLIGELPQLFGKDDKFPPPNYEHCTSRLSRHQSILFKPTPLREHHGHYLPWIGGGRFCPEKNAMREYLHFIEVNQPLCDAGFIGNPDLYGIGIRVGTYLQWLSSILANNLLPEKRSKLQQVYLIASFTICIVSFVSIIRKTCTFALEVVILHWLFWGGYGCVYIQPNLKPAFSEVEWPKLKVDDVALNVLVVAMAFQTQFLFWAGIFRLLPEMPCGTFILPINIPLLLDISGDSFRWFSFVLTIGYAFIATFIGFLFLTKTLRSVKRTVLLFPEWSHSVKQCEMFEELCILARLPLDFSKKEPSLNEWFKNARRFGGYPEKALPGWHRVAALEGRVRVRHRIKHVIFACANFISSITAIELMLKLNHVRGIDNINSSGQWTVLIVGCATCFATLMAILGDRLQKFRKRRSKATQGLDIELQPTRTPYRDAAGADVDALQGPNTVDAADTSGAAETVDAIHRDGPEFLMISPFAEPFLREDGTFRLCITMNYL